MSAKTLGRCDTLRRYVAGMPKQQVDDVRRVSRRLRDLVEPIAAGVYFFDEAHKAYEDIGLKGFALGYFPSRGACMGQVPGEVERGRRGATAIPVEQDGASVTVFAEVAQLPVGVDERLGRRCEGDG